MALSSSMPNSNTVDLTELVGTIMFKQVAMAQVASHLRFLPALSLASGERLVIPGQILDKLYVLLRGRLAVYEGDSQDKPIGYIHSGDCVGLSSFIDRQPCHVTIVADDPCRLLGLDEDHLVPLINSPTVLSRNLLLMLMKYIREKAKRVARPQPEPAMAKAETAAAPAPEPAPAKVAPTEHHVDPVTGCHNQRWLDETLDRLILRAATDRSPLSVVAVDVLDKSGLPPASDPQAVDDAMRQIAETLRQTVRPTDLLARHGNGAFLVVLPSTDLDKANAATSRIREAFVKSNPALSMAVGVVQMHAFVAGRKLVDDAFASLEKERNAHFEARRKAEAEAAAAAEIAALAEAQAREEAEAEAKRLAEQAENEAWAKAELERVEKETRAQAEAEAAAAAELAAQAEARAREEAEAEAKRLAEHTEKEAWAGAEVERVDYEAESEQMSMAPPPPGPATFQPNTPDVVELTDEESSVLFTLFTTPEEAPSSADSGSGEPASPDSMPDASPPAP